MQEQHFVQGVAFCFFKSKTPLGGFKIFFEKKLLKRLQGFREKVIF